MKDKYFKFIKDDKKLRANVPKEFRSGGSSRAKAALKRAQQAQKKIEEQIKDLEKEEFTVSSGGGMVSVVIMGDLKIKSININPEVVDKEEISMLSDLIVAAVNEAVSTVQEKKDAILQSETSGVDIDAMLGLI